MNGRRRWKDGFGKKEMGKTGSVVRKDWVMEKGKVERNGWEKEVKKKGRKKILEAKMKNLEVGANSFGTR